MGGDNNVYNGADDTHDMSEQPNETYFITRSTSYCPALDRIHVSQDYYKGNEFILQL